MQRKIVSKGKFSLSYYQLKHSEILPSLSRLIPKRRATVQWVTMHWTAGSYHTNYPSYQVLIDPENILVSPTMFTFGYHGHTWRRNSYNIGISFKAMASKDYPVTKEMMQAAAQVCFVLKKSLGLNWNQFKDHDYFSKIDGYDSARWDTQKKLYDKEAIKQGLKFETVYSRVLRYAKEIEKSQGTPIKKEKKAVKPEKLFPKLKGTPFHDVDPNRYSASAIVAAHEMGLLSGHKNADGSHWFKPSEPLTREQFAVAQNKMLTQLGLVNADKKDPEHIFYELALRLYEKGVIKPKEFDHMGNPVFELFEQVDYGTLLGLITGFSDNQKELMEVLESFKENL